MRLAMALAFVTVAACGSSGGGSDFGSSSSGGSSGSLGGADGGFGGDGGRSNCDPNAGDLEGCSCEGGPRSCFTVAASARNRNGCKDGSQTCQRQGEFSQWGPCTGEVTACVSSVGTVDGGSSGDAGKKDGLDAGYDAPHGDWVGASCTPGSVKEGPKGSFGCSDLGTGEVVIYCEAKGIWACFPAGSCDPTACAACLHQNGCDAPIANATGACKQGLQEAYDWIAACGPDRSSYFTSLGSACTGGVSSNSINSCKFSHCIGGSNNGPCSPY